MKLEFGCGENVPKDGFVGVDIRQFEHTKYVCNAWEIDQFPELHNQVEEIYSRHFLEHLTFYQADLLFSAWKKILKPGGKVITIVPDMDFHIKQWTNPNRKTTMNRKRTMNEEDWAISGFWGKQRDTENHDLWDVHKSGYDYELLKDSLERHGFVNVKRLPDKKKNLTVEAYKA